MSAFAEIKAAIEGMNEAFVEFRKVNTGRIDEFKAQIDELKKNGGASPAALRRSTIG